MNTTTAIAIICICAMGITAVLVNSPQKNTDNSITTNFEDGSVLIDCTKYSQYAIVSFHYEPLKRFENDTLKITRWLIQSDQVKHLKQDGEFDTIGCKESLEDHCKYEPTDYNCKWAKGD